jgi:hypothetical protein
MPCLARITAENGSVFKVRTFDLLLKPRMIKSLWLMRDVAVVEDRLLKINPACFPGIIVLLTQAWSTALVHTPS